MLPDPNTESHETRPSSFLTSREMASYLHISESALRTLVRRGQIPHLRLGPRTIRFDPQALDSWRKQFFDKGGHENGAEKSSQCLNLPVQDRWKNLEPLDRQSKPSRGRTRGAEAPKAGSIAALAAERILGLERSDLPGSEESRGRRKSA